MIQINLKANGDIVSQYDQALDEMEQQIQETRGFMQRHATQLAKLSNQSKVQEFEDTQLAAALQNTPNAQIYYLNMVAALNQVHMAAMIAKSTYFKPNEGNGAMVGTLLEVAGKLMPVGGGYIEVAGMIVNELGRRDVERKLGRFAEIATSSVEMDRIAQGVAKALVMSDRKGLNPKSQATHIQNIVRAVFEHELANVKGEQDVIKALVKKAEGREASAEREIHPGSKNAKPPVPVMSEADRMAAAKKQAALLVPALEENFERGKTDKFMEPKGDVDDALQARFETKLGSMRNAIFENVKGLDATAQARVENSLGAAMFDRSKRHSHFEQAFFKKSNFTDIMTSLKDQIKTEFAGKDVSKMEETEIDAITRKLSQDLANKIAPKEVQEKREAGMGK
jgi:hypothetical protein